MPTERICFGCKLSFSIEQLTKYPKSTQTQSHYYCPECLIQKQSRDYFSEHICILFGLKTPGPRIWTERKRLQAKYGYSDHEIIDCLEYLYEVEHKKKLAESLYLVCPAAMERLKKYQTSKQGIAFSIIQAINTETTKYIVPIKENNTPKVQWNPDDWLDDD